MRSKHTQQNVWLLVCSFSPDPSMCFSPEPVGYVRQWLV